MATSVLSSAASTVLSASKASATVSASPSAPAQAGVLEGANPTTYSASNPIILFVIQASIIVIFCRLLHFPLGLIRQPRVIAEVIGGILLGPSVMGRIPGFTAAIFPTASMPILSTVANLALILFLFLVGLEVDLRLFTKNWKVAFSVGLAGMALPFGLGCAIAVGLYNEFQGESGTVKIDFGTFMLFIAVAVAITAFPVLTRILSELKLLDTPVGVIVLSAGVGNDVFGWVLLALCVALVNAGSGITALYVLLCAVGWVLFLVYLVRPVFLLILRRTGSLEKGPTQTVVALTLLMVLISAFFTSIIGVHPMFGGFLIGLICPHDGGFAIKMVEKVEDLVTTLLLPLYFANSGLSTNLGLLNNGITWAYVVGVIAVAFCGKFIGGAIAARACRLLWRESFTIGALMSCKGLVELIVLNIGLQAKILSTRTFTMFVVMALITTVATTPLTMAFYPPWYQQKVARWRRGEIDWEGNQLATSDDSTDHGAGEKSDGQVHSVVVDLNMETLPSMFQFLLLLRGRSTTATGTKSHPSLAKSQMLEQTAIDQTTSAHSLEVHGVRLLELTERESSTMKVAELDSLTHNDPVLAAFGIVSQLNNLSTTADVEVIPSSLYASALTGKAAEAHSDLLLVPCRGRQSQAPESPMASSSAEPFNWQWNGQGERIFDAVSSSASYDTAVFVDHGFAGMAPTHTLTHAQSHGISRTTSSYHTRLHSATMSTSSAVVGQQSRDGHHIFLPYTGGADDRRALRLVLQMLQHDSVTATVLHIKSSSESASEESSSSEPVQRPENAALKNSKSSTLLSRVGVHKIKNNSRRKSNETHDDDAFLDALVHALPSEIRPRILVTSLPTSTSSQSQIVDDIVTKAKDEACTSADLIILGRNLQNDKSVAGSDSGLGPIAEKLLASDGKASVVVISSKA